jgi:hypothetical protein
VLLEGEVQIVPVGEHGEPAQVLLDQGCYLRECALEARVDADVLDAEDARNPDHLVHVRAQGGADLEVDAQTQAARAVGELAQPVVAHPAQAPFLAVEEVDAGAGQAVPMREVEHIIGPVCAVGQVAEEGVGVGEQGCAVDPFDQGAGQLIGQAGQGPDLRFVEAGSQECPKLGVCRGHRWLLGGRFRGGGECHSSFVRR